MNHRHTDQNRHILSIVIFLLIPVLIGLTLFIISGTSPFRLDGWNASWSDESGYYRVLRLLRNVGSPRGAAGYNEIEAPGKVLGAYSIFTYLPYYFTSFLTGVKSHNFVYVCNLILCAAGCGLFAVLSKTDLKKALLSALFFCTHLILGRYIWSGMVETSYICYMLIALGLTLRLSSEDIPARRSRSMRLCRIFLITAFCLDLFLLCLTRPYYLPLFLLPAYFSLFSGQSEGNGRRVQGRLSLKGLTGAALILASAAAVFFLFFYINDHYVAQYFDNGASIYDKLHQLTASGTLAGMLREILHQNVYAVQRFGEYLSKWRWPALAAVIFGAEWVILLTGTIRDLVHRSCRAVPDLLWLAAGAAAYEGTVLIYNPLQSHRILLAFTLIYGLLLIWRHPVLAVVGQILLIVLMTLVLLHGRGKTFRLPQINDKSIMGEKQEEEMRQLRECMPLMEEEWDNTIAKTPEGAKAYQYMIPEYLSFNICGESTLEEKLKTGTLKSRYLLLPKKSGLNSLCGKYPLIWKGHGHRIYEITQKPDKTV